MVFCLDDGTELLYGPASTDDPATAILHETAPPGEAATRAQVHTTDLTAVMPSGTVGVPQAKGFDKRLLFAPLAIAVVLIGGLFSFRYATQGKQIESIAVMPFVNDSGNPAVEYLSDGMTETLIKSLSQIPNLAVKSRSTVFYYKGKEVTPKKIGEELGVQAVLLGHVGGKGDDLKLSLELVNAQTQDVIWSEQYDRKQSDLVNLQSDIAKAVSAKLRSKLSGEEEAKVSKSATTSPEAYQAYLKGRYYWNQRTADTVRLAIQQFRTATEIDPNYALAYTGLADCYVLLPEYAGTPPRDAVTQAKTFADRAIAIDDQAGETHATLAMIHNQLWEWTEAEKEFKRAIELSPNYATAYHWYSILLKNMGRFEEAGRVIRHAAELDPLSGAIGNNVAMIYQVENNDEASIKTSLRVIELYPNYGRAYEYLGLSYLRMGRKDDAVATMEKAVELSKRQNVILSELGYVYARAGKRKEAMSLAEELQGKYARNEAAGHEVAAIYSGLGEKDKAFEWLEKDFENRDSRLPSFRWEMQFEPLRDDPRFKDLVRRIGLPE
jgi:TolB-like protein/Tfp pilus assembly protein PilF